MSRTKQSTKTATTKKGARPAATHQSSAGSKPARRTGAARRRGASSPLNPTTIVIGLVLLLVVAAGIYFVSQRGAIGAPTTRAVTEITVAEAAVRREAGAFILDVREPSEWEDFHVPDSTLIPLGQLEQRLNEVPKDEEVVVICNSGNRSKAGAEILLAAGYTNVTSMAGGVQEWRSNGLPTTSDQ